MTDKPKTNSGGVNPQKPGGTSYRGDIQLAAEYAYDRLNIPEGDVREKLRQEMVSLVGEAITITQGLGWEFPRAIRYSINSLTVAATPLARAILAGIFGPEFRECKEHWQARIRPSSKKRRSSEGRTGR